MGIVYKARQIALQRLVALKMIRTGEEADTAALARFRVEAEAVAELQHPNIVQIYEIGGLDSALQAAFLFFHGRSSWWLAAAWPQQWLAVSGQWQARKGRRRQRSWWQRLPVPCITLISTASCIAI